MSIRNILLYLSLSLVIIAVGAGTFYRLAAPAPTPTPLTPQSDEETAVKRAIEAAMQTEKPQALALLMYDTRIEGIKFSADGNWATGWLIPLDPHTGEVVSTEPGLAIVHRTAQGWLAYVPSDPDWSVIIHDVPADLIPQEQKNAWIRMAEFRASAVTAPIHGYKLPWTGGDTMVLTQSVGHDRYTPSGSAHFAFDFAMPGYPSGMFNVLAAKGGTVKQAVWSHANGDPANANYIVLEDTSTTPTTYQLYMHLAKDSIPAPLRTVGASVRHGQLIGVADDTGVSSGNHLHFMVHTYPSSYWGTSIDITFDEVSINGGRPRIPSDLAYCKSSDVCNSTQTSYVSDNFMSPDHIPPTGGITSPPEGAVISTNPLPLQGWAKDENSGLRSAQFKALYNDEWHLLGNAFNTGSFSYNWDMCADKVPDGPVSLALTIQDKAMNQASGLPGLTHFSKNINCPPAPPACNPTTNQVALFASPNMAGRCVVLGIGNYASASQLGNLGDDDAASILVGANVQATLYIDNNFQGRGDTFFASDYSLVDNRIGADTVSSVKVQSRTASPSVPALIWPDDGASLPFGASFSLSWDNTAGATQFQLQISHGANLDLLTDWVAQSFWRPDQLPPGTYTWSIKARNANGESNWTASRSFQILNPPAGGESVVINPPYTDTMETSQANWTSVNWILSGEANHTPDGSLGWKYDVGSANGYDNGKPNEGFLTSPVISLPASGVYYLRFYYRYETESQQTNWDQRWVQISVNQGPFNNLLQLSDDPMGYWLRGKVISLAQYAGQNVRFRFYFTTLDRAYNQFPGWSIDDFSITADPPPSCADNDNSVSEASLISSGQTLNGIICPGGDVDYYKFQGIAGQQIGIHTQAQAIGSPLDTQITLIDIDGSSPLASNDDIVQYERTDSLIYFTVSRTGVYYLRVQAWDHPEAGNNDDVYSLTFNVDNNDPSASFLFPKEGSSLPSGKVTLKVAGRDDQSGVSLVRFYWHSNDWQNSRWNYIGEDWDSSDGWNIEFDFQGVNNTNGVAVYAVVFDWAGNWVGTGAWNLHSPMIYLPLIVKAR